MSLTLVEGSRSEALKQASISAHSALLEISERSINEKRDFRIGLRQIGGRLETMRQVHLSFGRNALGYSHDEECRNGIWAYLTSMRTASLYQGIAAVAAHASLDAGRRDIEIEERLEALVDIHVLKRLSLRAGAMDLDSQMAVLRPAIGWCATANRIGIRGRFAVPLRQGILFCRRDPLPDLAGIEAHGPVSRIVTFYSLDELNKRQKECWAGLRDAGAIDEAPAFPSLSAPGMNEMTHICAMAGADLVMRAETVRAAV